MIDQITSLADQLVGRGILLTYGIRIHIGQHGTVSVGLKGDQKVIGEVVRMIPLRNPTTGKPLKGVAVKMGKETIEVALERAVGDLVSQITLAYFSTQEQVLVKTWQEDEHLEETYEDRTGGRE